MCRIRLTRDGCALPLRSLLGCLTLLAATVPPALAHDLVPTTVTLSPATNCGECSLRPGDEMWVISTRGLGDPRCTSPQLPAVRRFTCDRGWVESSISEMCTAPPMPTLVYLHGNRFTYADSIVSGWTVYHLITCGDPAQRLRMVIWSWPSEQVAGPIRDARVKNDRAYYEGYYLAQYLGCIQQSAPLSLLGYSYGARITAAALDGLQRGAVAGLRLPPSTEPLLAPARVALLAAAMENIDLSAQGRYPLAVNLMDQLLVTVNRLDPALRRYHALERNHRYERAMGSAGVAGSFGGTQLQVVNATRTVGRSHDDDRYYASPWLAEQLRRSLIW